MKIEIIKSEPKEYKAGDILSIGNPYEVVNYLLYENLKDNEIGLLDLNGGLVFVQDGKFCSNFDSLINEALRTFDGVMYEVEVSNEWKIFSGHEATLVLGNK